tara:strand:- start:3481 stop:6252 length:2772 start_codon:yes stop_codon:yes gene_type:complete
MASTQLSPGVAVLERDLTNVVNSTVDNVAAVVGAFEKGPIEDITTITSEKELLSTFGKPNNLNYEFWFTAAQFLLYGGSLRVVRADNSSLKNAIDTAQFTITSFSSTDTILTVESATDFDVSDVLFIDAELMVVQAVSGSDVTVTRGQLQTSAASHAANSSITLIEPAGTSSTINEGSTFTSSDTTLTVTSATALAGSTNSYIKIDDEFLRISGVAGDDLTVERGVLGSTAAAHTDGSTVTLQTVTAAKTEINEQTSTGITPPIIKSMTDYEANVEDAANNWKWAGRTAGKFANSLRIVMTDAGADQILYLADPSSTEWEFTNNAEVSFSNANIYGKVYSYTVIVSFDAGATLVGSFEKDNYITAVSGGVTGRVVAWDAEARKLELTIDDTASDIIEVGDTITELANNSNTPGSATGDSGVVSGVSRQLRVSLNPLSPLFQANQSVIDKNAATISIANVESDYTTRSYGLNARWTNLAARPTTSAWVEERGGHNDLMHIIVIDGDGQLTGTPGSVVEKFLNVSKASDAKSPQGDNIYYKDVIKSQSQFILWGSHETGDIYDKDVNASGGFGLSGINREFDLIKSSSSINDLDDPTGTNPAAIPLIGTKHQATIRYSLQGGVDGYSVARPETLAAFNLFDDAETIDIDYILMGPSMSTVGDSIAKAQHIISIANSRKDCMAFISPHRGDVIGQPSTNDIVTKTIDYFDTLASTSYAVFDNNYKYIYDKYNDVYRYIPCNGDMAGLVLSTTLNSEAWFSPAGFNRGTILNAIKLAYSPLKDHRDRLYAARVNPIVAFPGEGIILFGDKTALGYSSAFDRINVRRLFLVLEESIAVAAKNQLFELNDEFTRAQFKNIVEPFLRSVQSRRGIVDFLVVCDATNNPAESIDRGEFFAEIFVKPARSINFITLTFTATRTGASFSEIVS